MPVAAVGHDTPGSVTVALREALREFVGDHRVDLEFEAERFLDDAFVAAHDRTGQRTLSEGSIAIAQRHLSVVMWSAVGVAKLEADEHSELLGPPLSSATHVVTVEVTHLRRVFSGLCPGFWPFC